MTDKNIIDELQARISVLEQRLEIETAFELILNGDNAGMREFFLTEEQKLTFPDKVFCLEIDIKILRDIIKEKNNALDIADTLVELINKYGASLPLEIFVLVSKYKRANKFSFKPKRKVKHENKT